MKIVVFSIFILIGVLNPLGIHAINDSISVMQTISNNISPKERKEYINKIKAVNDSIAHVEAITAMKDGAFILIAEKTMDTSFISADRRYNFFLVENNKIIVQSGFSDIFGGNNKYGGYTIPSDIVSDISVIEKDNGEVNCDFKLLGEYLSGEVHVKLDKKGSFAEIIILQNGSSGDEKVEMLKSGSKTVMFGNIIPFDASLIGDAIEMGRLYVPEGWDPFTLGKRRDVGTMMNYTGNSYNK